MNNYIFANQGKTEQEKETTNLGIVEGVKQGIQAYGWLKPSDFEDAEDRKGRAVVDTDFDPMKALRQKEAREQIDNPEVYKSLLAGSFNEEQFNYNLDRALATQEAAKQLEQSESPFLYSFAGAMLSPETFIPVGGAVSKIRYADDLVKLARQTRKAKTLRIAKDTAEATAITGVLTSSRAAQDVTYTSTDAMIDTLAVGGLTSVMTGGSVFIKSRKGAKLKADLDEAYRVRSQLGLAKMEQKSAQTMKDKLAVDITENRIQKADTEYKPDALPVVDRNLSDSELRSLASNKLSRSEYRELYGNIQRIKPEAQENALKKAADHLEGRKAITKLNEKNMQRVQQHIDALEAESILVNRSMGVPDNVKAQDVPSFKRNQIRQSMEQSFDFLSRRRALQERQPEEVRKALYADYHKQLDARYSDLLSVFERSGMTINKTQKKIDELTKPQQLESNVDKRGLQYSLKGLKQGKVTPLLQSTLGAINDYERALRSSNPVFRSIVGDLLQSSVEGGRSVSSIAETNFEDMIKSVDRMSHKDMQTFLSDFKKANPDSAKTDAFEHITNLIEGHKFPTSDAEKAVRDAFRDFFRDALERVKAYNPNYKTETDKFYVPRLINQDVIHRLINEGGEAKVVKALAQGIKKAQWGDLVETYGDELAEKLVNAGAQGYWKKLKRLNGADESLEDVDLFIRDGHALTDLTDDELAEAMGDELIGRLVGQKVPKTGKPDRLKTRMRLSTNVEVDGFDLRELFERDVIALSTRYAREMSSWMGFAEKGYYTPEDVIKAVNKAKHGAKDHTTGLKEQEKLRDYIGMIKGVPTFKDSTGNSLAQGLMAVQFVLKMGAAPIMALFEVGRSVAMTGHDAVRSLPFVSTWSRNIHRKFSHEEVVQLGDDLQAIMPHKHQPSIYFSTRMDVQDDAAMKKFTQLTRMAADRWGRVNLMEQIDRHTRDTAINAMHQRLIKHFVKNEDLGKLIDFDYMGLDKEIRAKIAKSIKDTSQEKTGTFGKFYTVDFDKWDKYTLLRYKEALHLAERRLVQKGFLGEGSGERLPPIFRIPLQFRGFGLTAIGKQFIADVAAAERQGVTGYAEMAFSWLVMGVFTQLGLETRSRIVNAGRDDYEERVLKQTTGENAVATWLRYHPSLGWTRDLLDVTVGSELARAWIDKESYNEIFGEVYRSTGMTNEGLLESTPVGSSIVDVMDMAQDPTMKNLTKFAPGSVHTRLIKNVFSEQ